MSSQALKDSGLVWDAETPDSYLTDPGAAVPGTTMSPTVPNSIDRADVIAYLATLIVPEGLDLDKLPLEANVSFDLQTRLQIFNAFFWM